MLTLFMCEVCQELEEANETRISHIGSRLSRL